MRFEAVAVAFLALREQAWAQTPAPSYVPSDMPSLMPSLLPTMVAAPPTPAPVATETSPPTYSACFGSFTNVLQREFNADLTTQRNYHMCPETEYGIGFFTQQGGITNGMYPIILRDNVQYICGQFGTREENCIVSGGQWQVVASDIFYNGGTVSNAVLRGFTFRGSFSFSSWLEQAGDVTFIDCVFEEMNNPGPIYINFNSNRRRQLKGSGQDPWKPSMEDILSIEPEVADQHAERNLQPGATLVTSFQQCLFENNYALPSGTAGAIPGLITANWASDELIFDECVFRNNTYGDPSAPANGWGIQSFGPFTMTNSCWEDNDFFGFGPVQIPDGASYSASGNYGTADDDVTCQFVSFAVSSNEFFAGNVECVAEYDSATCAASAGTPTTPPPTTPPPTTPPPMTAPVPQPTPAPVPQPTPAPVPQPTPAPVPPPTTPPGPPPTAPPVAIPTVAPRTPTTPPTSDSAMWQLKAYLMSALGVATFYLML